MYQSQPFTISFLQWAAFSQQPLWAIQQLLWDPRRLPTGWKWLLERYDGFSIWVRIRYFPVQNNHPATSLIKKQRRWKDSPNPFNSKKRGEVFSSFLHVCIIKNQKWSYSIFCCSLPHSLIPLSTVAFSRQHFKTHLLSLQLLSSLFSHCPLTIKSHFEVTGSWKRGLHPRQGLLPPLQTSASAGPSSTAARTLPDAQQCHKHALVQLRASFGTWGDQG